MLVPPGTVAMVRRGALADRDASLARYSRTEYGDADPAWLLAAPAVPRRGGGDWVRRLRGWFASFTESATSWAAAPRSRIAQTWGSDVGSEDRVREALRRWLLGDDTALEEWMSPFVADDRAAHPVRTTA